jgi:hypothetical protein
MPIFRASKKRLKNPFSGYFYVEILVLSQKSVKNLAKIKILLIQ